MCSRSKLILSLAGVQSAELNGSARNEESTFQNDEPNAATRALKRTLDWVKANNNNNPLVESIPLTQNKKFEDHFESSIVSETTKASCTSSSNCSSQQTNYKEIENKLSNRYTEKNYSNSSVVPIFDQRLVSNTSNSIDSIGKINDCSIELKSHVPNIFEYTSQIEIRNEINNSNFVEVGNELYEKDQVTETIIYTPEKDNINSDEDFLNIKNLFDEFSSMGHGSIINQQAHHASVIETNVLSNSNHGNSSDKSLTSVDDENKDEDFDIDNYSSSSESETSNNEINTQFFESNSVHSVETQKREIQISRKLSVLNTLSHFKFQKKNDEHLSIHGRIQRKIESTKKETRCKFCNKDIISKNFVRHMETYHKHENELKKILMLPKKSRERRDGFALLRRDTNFELFLNGEIRPCRKSDASESESMFFPCIYCKGLFKKKYLKRHTVFCRNKRSIKNNLSRNYISDSHTFTVCASGPTNVISKLNVKEQVFNIMKGDDIAFEAKKDLLIVNFGESYLKQHKRERKEYACSNRMRELSRFLMAFRRITENYTITLKEVLLPKHFDNILAAVRNISGYDPHNKVFSAPSLATHMGTYLKGACDELNHLILRESPGFTCESVEEMKNWRQGIKNLKDLLTTRWNTEISSLANKDMQEKRWNKPLLVPLVNDVKIFRDGVLKIAKDCEKKFYANEYDVGTYKLLVNCTLSLLILFNRRRIGDVQYLKIEDYRKNTSSNFKDFEIALTDSEKVLTQQYKRVVNSGKGFRAVVILVPKILQKFIGTLLRFRTEYISDKNEYIFALPHSKIKWGQGDVAIRNLTKNFKLQRPDAITSNKLRKQIATVTQILSLSKEESKQFSKFMGHTEKTHDQFYELPVDIYQTAKVSKLLLMMEKGKLPIEYKGKSLEEIEIDVEFPEENDDLDTVNDASASCETIVFCSDKPNPIESHEMHSQGEELLGTSEKIAFEESRSASNEKRKLQRKVWSRNEIDLITNNFEEKIRTGIYPTAEEIRNFSSKNKINRTLPVIKAKIQHLIKLKK